MKLSSLTAIAFFVSSAFAQLTINTPANVVVCQPILLTWSGGTPPYSLSVLPGSQPGAAALVNLGTQTGTAVTWTVNLAAGTSIGLTLRDNTGLIAQSAPFTILNGTDSSCVGKTASTSAGSAPATPIATGATSATATTPATTPTGTSLGLSSKSAGSASASTTGSKNAAPTHGAQIGAAGLIGAAVMAVLA